MHGHRFMATPNRRESDDRSTRGEHTALWPSVFAMLQKALRGGAFWTGVALPFVILGMLLTGIDNSTEWALILILLSINAPVLYVGHSHRLD